MVATLECSGVYNKLYSSNIIIVNKQVFVWELPGWSPAKGPEVKTKTARTLRLPFRWRRRQILWAHSMEKLDEGGAVLPTKKLEAVTEGPGRKKQCKIGGA